MRQLRTAGNYFIINLAAADLMLTVVNMPSNFVGTHISVNERRDKLITFHVQLMQFNREELKSQKALVVVHLITGALVGSHFFNQRPTACWGELAILKRNLCVNLLITFNLPCLTQCWEHFAPWAAFHPAGIS